jgi:hypothetical protein
VRSKALGVRRRAEDERLRSWEDEKKIKAGGVKRKALGGRGEALGVRRKA